MDPLEARDFIRQLQQFASGLPNKDAKELTKHLEPLLSQANRQIDSREKFASEQEFQDHLKDIYQALTRISTQINKEVPTSAGNVLAARVQGVAQSLLLPKEELPNLPPEKWLEIFSLVRGNALTLSSINKGTQPLGKIATEENFNRGELSWKDLDVNTFEQAAKKLMRTPELTRADFSSFTVDLSEESYSFWARPIEIVRDTLWCLFTIRPDLRFLTFPKCVVGAYGGIERYKIPIEFRNLTQLKVLDVSNAFCPRDLSLTQLERLNLGENSFPNTIENLKNLKHLSFRSIPPGYGHREWIPWSDLPPAIGTLKQLESMECSIPALSNLRPVGKMEQLKSLSLWLNGELSEMSNELLAFPNLETLCLKGYLTLSGTMGQLHQLRELDLRECRHLEELPDELYSLPNLEVLRLPENIKLSPKLGLLKKLREVEFKGTTVLPIEVSARDQLLTNGVKIVPDEAMKKEAEARLRIREGLTQLLSWAKDFSPIREALSTQHLEQLEKVSKEDFWAVEPSKLYFAANKALGLITDELQAFVEIPPEITQQISQVQADLETIRASK